MHSGFFNVPDLENPTNGWNRSHPGAATCKRLGNAMCGNSSTRNPVMKITPSSTMCHLSACLFIHSSVYASVCCTRQAANSSYVVCCSLYLVNRSNSFLQNHPTWYLVYTTGWVAGDLFFHVIVEVKNKEVHHFTLDSVLDAIFDFCEDLLNMSISKMILMIATQIY